MSYYKLPPNYYLQFYPPPPHPPPPPAFQTTTQKFLRFHDFHHTHFIQNRNFFHALNSTTPWWSWKVEEEGVEEGSRYQQQQPEEYENYEYQEEYYEEREEEKAEGVEFVLSEEAIAMFRFSELRKQQRKLFDFDSPLIEQVSHIIILTLNLKKKKIFFSKLRKRFQSQKKKIIIMTIMIIMIMMIIYKVKHHQQMIITLTRNLIHQLFRHFIINLAWNQKNCMETLARSLIH
ncbi:hypothetical protein GLOIN_2v1624649 [Rhizophagus irregularis DAOM 181602=DAOM 197198]|uniref:Uncharacterized protein n=1 Tax=Rhizophagus irregularis (strain DAOM 181602 / DAOM 197198 / MUCL 43194) TaxID=747089 RepID=A0A2P4PW51_RHIID|nr:hypothetical protein GLOIN_2v1624649 [Rhizophagus irregularis DAOM 181602=DAOM 197198]POG69637.1 hypothetical protein GLOIN_2v1624649 [Rhizophagus irregularis DAOM 181602=DAOM 197198]|eukprot:XP_025176503.1 hypothetical protein GLOIN_2v1624649 [Rhizophagus irregularis DAOM 181602=DAOM 197198]